MSISKSISITFPYSVGSGVAGNNGWYLADPFDGETPADLVTFNQGVACALETVGVLQNRTACHGIMLWKPFTFTITIYSGIQSSAPSQDFALYFAAARGTLRSFINFSTNSGVRDTGAPNAINFDYTDGRGVEYNDLTNFPFPWGQQNTLTYASDGTNVSQASNGVVYLTHPIGQTTHIDAPEIGLENFLDTSQTFFIVQITGTFEQSIWTDGFTYANGNLVGKGNWIASAFSATSPVVINDVARSEVNDGGSGAAAVDKVSIVNLDWSKDFTIVVAWQNQIPSAKTPGVDSAAFYLGDSEGAANGFFIGLSYDLGNSNAGAANSVFVDISDSGSNDVSHLSTGINDSASHALTWAKTGTNTTKVSVDDTVVITSTAFDYTQLQVMYAATFFASNSTTNGAAGMLSIIVDGTALGISARAIRASATTISLAFALSNPTQLDHFTLSVDGGSVVDPVTSPRTVTTNPLKPHTFLLTGYDRAGNVIATDNVFYRPPSDDGSLVVLDVL